MYCSLSKVTENEFASLRQCLLKTGTITVTDLPKGSLDIITKIIPMHSTLNTAVSPKGLSCGELEQLRNLDKALARLANDVAHLILKILSLPDDALDYYYSEEADKSLATVLQEVTNTVSTRTGHPKDRYQSVHEVLSLHFNNLSDTECNVRLGALIDRMLEDCRPKPPRKASLKSELAFHMNVKESLTYLELYDSFVFCPAEHRAHHDIYAGKRLEGLPENLSYLCLVQAEIDAAIMYHLATSSLGEIEFESLTDRAAKSVAKLRITLQHIHQINHLWGGNAYTIIGEYRYHRFCYFISCKALPAKAESRKLAFRAICRDYARENPLGLVPTSSTTTTGNSENTTTALHSDTLKRKASASMRSKRADLLRKQPKLSFKVTRSTPGTVLERIRKKEQANKSKSLDADAGTDTVNQRFICSQLPSICRTLLCLAPVSGSSRSFSRAQVLTKLSDSLTSKMSPLELSDALDSLASKVPEFCNIVKVGDVYGVKLQPGWNMQRLSEFIDQRPTVV